MTLLDGEILWNLIWILPLLAVLFYYACRKRKALLERFLGDHADDPACVNGSSVLRFWRGVLFAGTVILLIVAAARPSWGFRILPYSGQGRDLMVVFDVSKSMLSQDVRPSRLEHAKWLVRQLCERTPGDRFGLIAFAGHAFLECPLTIDRTSFLQSVDELSVDSIPVGGTNIQQALSEAIRGFRAAETPHRAVILITDGDELTGDCRQAIGAIVKLKIPLFILGIGDPSQPAIVQLPDGKGGIQTLKDRSGNVVSVPLNEKMLSALARETGGIYVRSTTTDPNLKPIEDRIRQLEKHEIDSGKQTRPIERPLYPLIGALILFCCWLILGERRSGPRRSTAKLLLLTFGLGTALSLSLSAQEQASSLPVPPPAGQETKAEKQPVKVEPKLTPEQLYNLGLQAQTQEKDPAKAVQLYEQAIAAVNAAPEVRSRSSQNLGVMNHQKARAMLQQAVQTVQAQQLDGALQQTDGALKQLAATEEIYREALREGGANTGSVARNQHQLLQDRRKAEELKKKIEELKKQQQQARQDTQQAKDQQKQQEQKKDNQNQKQQDQKNSQQDQQKQQNQKDNQQNQTEKARESVRKLEHQARDLNQKKLEEQAKQAGEEIDKARQAEQKNQRQEAEKHLQKALDHLGKDQPKPDQHKQDQQKQNQQKNDQQDQQKRDQKQDQQKQDKPLPKPGEASKSEAKPEPEKEIDKEQAQALLELMADDEKKLKDELKARMKQNYGTRPVEKDW